ncbi:MAG: PAS domain S-box protein [Candidatus Odinarchaeota archaeon]
MNQDVARTLTAGEGKHHSSGDIKVILVDDEEEFLVMSKLFLKNLGDDLVVDTECSPLEALWKINSGTYDAIVADYDMPGLSGLELLKELRAGGNQVPFIMVTGRGREEVAIKALNLGVDYFLKKEGNARSLFGELCHMIRTVVKHRRAERLSRQLQIMVDMEKLVVNISTHFLEVTQGNLNSEFNHALQIIGAFTGVERGHVFLFTEDGTTVNQVYEWQVEGLEPVYGFLKGKPVNHGSWIMKELDRFETIQISDIDDLPADASMEKEVSSFIKIRSFVTVPLFLGHSLAGTFGFSSHERKTLSKDVMALLHIVKNIFISALDRVRKEEALKKNEQKYRFLFECVPVGIGIADENGNILDFNQAMLDLTGYSKEELLRTTVREMYIDHRERDGVLRVLHETGQVRDHELKLRRKNGEVYHALLNLDQHSFDGKRIILTTARDISQRARLMNAIEAERQQFLSVLVELPGIVYLQQKDLSMRFLNRYSLEKFPDLISEPCYRVFYGSDAPCNPCIAQQVITTGRQQEREKFTVNDRQYLVNCYPFTDPDGTPLVLALGLDITERENGKNELLATKARLQRLISCTPVIIQCNHEGENSRAFVSDAIEILLGYNPQEFASGLEFWIDLIHPDDIQQVMNGLKEFREKGYQVREYRVQHKNGTYRWIRDESWMVRDIKGNLVEVVSHITDITGQKEINESSRGSNEFNPDDYQKMARLKKLPWKGWNSTAFCNSKKTGLTNFDRRNIPRDS